MSVSSAWVLLRLCSCVGAQSIADWVHIPCLKTDSAIPARRWDVSFNLLITYNQISKSCERRWRVATIWWLPVPLWQLQTPGSHFLCQLVGWLHPGCCAGLIAAKAYEGIHTEAVSIHFGSCGNVNALRVDAYVGAIVCPRMSNNYSCVRMLILHSNLKAQFHPSSGLIWACKHAGVHVDTDLADSSDTC